MNVSVDIPSFIQIREGQYLFCVDLTWNDPITMCVVLPLAVRGD